MPERFGSGVYAPELAKLMMDAHKSACERVEGAPGEEETMRHYLASAIIDLIDTGVRDHDELVAEAIATLAVAKNISGEKFALKAKSPP
jgi:hypothetical protein